MAGTRPILFIRVGWLEFYDERRDPGPPLRGGSYNITRRGSETNNHRPLGGWCYGYVQTGASTLGIDLQRLGAPRRAAELGGVTVIEVATPPGGGQVVVGWFENATCLPAREARLKGIYGSYNFYARQRDSHVLLLSHRTIEVPKGRGALGQSNICYADSRTRWVQRVLRHVLRRGHIDASTLSAAVQRPRRRALARGQGALLDVAKRLEIERYAMERAMLYFEEAGYKVTDISRDESIDLRCRRGNESFDVEVKGTQGTARKITLLFTKNEIDLANDARKRTMLFVLHGVDVARTAKGWRATGGEAVCASNWRPKKARLVALHYRYLFDVQKLE